MHVLLYSTCVCVCVCMFFVSVAVCRSSYKEVLHAFNTDLQSLLKGDLQALADSSQIKKFQMWFTEEQRLWSALLALIGVVCFHCSSATLQFLNVFILAGTTFLPSIH